MADRLLKQQLRLNGLIFLEQKSGPPV